MPTIKKLEFATGTDVTAPADLAFESSTTHLEAYADDAAFVTANGSAIEGDIYLNTTLEAPRAYIGGSWRTGLMASDAADATKTVGFDLTGSTTGTLQTLDFNGTNSRTYTFPDFSGVIILSTGTQSLDDKTLTNSKFTSSFDVSAPGSATIAASIGANTLTLGGVASTVEVAGNFIVQGTTTTLNTATLEVEDQNIVVNNNGTDVTAQGAGITVERTGTTGSMVYDSAAATRWKAGDLGSEVEIVDKSTAQTLTNKTLDAASNTFSNIPFSATTGVLPTTQGGTGVNGSATFPTSGVVATRDAAETLLNKATVSSTGLATGALNVPAGTTGQRPGTPSNSMIRYNSDTNSFEGYQAGSWSAIGGGGASGGVLDVLQTSHGFAIGDAVYFTGSAYAKARADAANTAEVIGVVGIILDVNNFKMYMSGALSGLSGLTAGENYFLSPSVAGQLTATEPTTVGHVSVPVFVATSATTAVINIMRGAVVGGANVRTSVGLANNATTSVQSFAAYEAAELTGWVTIAATTPLKFYLQAQVAKNGAGTDYNVAWQATGDTYPVGFNVTITAAGLLQVTLPNLAGFTSASINYALNAPAVGTTFPLSIDTANLVNKNRIQTKIATTNYTTSTAAIIAFNGLTIGKTYRLVMKAAGKKGTSGAGNRARLRAYHNSVEINYCGYEGNDGVIANDFFSGLSSMNVFVAAATTVSIDADVNGTGSVISGSTSTTRPDGSMAILEELNIADLTTAFT